MHPALLMVKFFAIVVVIIAGWFAYLAWKDKAEPRGKLDPLPTGEPGMVELLIRRTDDIPKDPSFRK